MPCRPGQHASYTPPPHEPVLSRSKRRGRGVYYTPSEIVRQIVDRALQPLLAHARPKQPPRIVDPACGAGEFLVEAAVRLLARYGKGAAAEALFGVDIDPAAVAAARQRLHQLGLPRKTLAANIRCADGLAAGTFEPASFDCVLANPPYLSIRQLAKSLSAEQINNLRQRFRTARGNFDLYVLFIERAIELLRRGGRFGLIVPNKWATLDYARPCRELLLAETTLEQVIDLSAERVFAAASVYPHVLVLRREPAAATHRVLYSSAAVPQPPGAKVSKLPQRLLSPVAISFTPLLDVESRASTVPLGELCTLSCGTAGFAAQRVAKRLFEADECAEPGRRRAQSRNATEGAASADFITSGNIDRYAIATGNVRYLKRLYVRPRLPLDVPELTPAKRRLFQGTKIVIAGMSRRLEAAWDDRGLALGVQVFAASDFRVDPFYLLALLNSKLLSYLFRTRFAAKRLAGGYLAINKGQLGKLPIVTGNAADAGKLGILAQQMSQTPTPAFDAKIDDLVYRLYRLASDEVAQVEAELAAATARAA